jgi:monovalent cation:H+ antiporter, CPA1 family
MPSPLEKLPIVLLIICIIAMIVRRLRLPYTIGLVIAGAVLSFVGLHSSLVLTSELILSVLLPPLIFEAAFYIPWKDLRADMKPILLLASIGTLLATAFITLGMHFGAGWEWQSALLFGALIAATDPVSVIATFKEAGMHGRLKLLVEAESLFNDGVAAVLFSIVSAWALRGHISPSFVVVDLFLEVVGGVVIGLVVGIGVLWIAGKTDDRLVEISLTVVAAYGSFLLAQHFHTSGVLATLCCALLIGNYGSLGSITDAGREAVGSFWEFAAFLANSLIFLLIGEHDRGFWWQFSQYAVPLSWAIGLVVLGRALTVYPLCAVFLRSTLKVSLAHQHALFWGGLRGALALALVLSLPSTLPRRGEIIATTFGVVVFSVIVQGLTMTPLLRRLGLLTYQSRVDAPKQAE